MDGSLHVTWAGWPADSVKRTRSPARGHQTWEKSMTPVLSARLEGIRLSAAVQFFLMEQSSVILRLRNQFGSGHVIVTDGRFRSASFNGLTGAQAVVEMLAMGDSNCDVQVCEGRLSGEPLPDEPMGLIMQALQLQETWSDLAPCILLCEDQTSKPSSELVEWLLSGATLEDIRQELRLPLTQITAEVEHLLKSGAWVRASPAQLPHLVLTQILPAGPGGTRPEDIELDELDSGIDELLEEGSRDDGLQLHVATTANGDTTAPIAPFAERLGMALAAEYSGDVMRAATLFAPLVEEKPESRLMKYRLMLALGRVQIGSTVAA